MKRMETSVGRVALPPFDTSELLKLIQKLVTIDARWIPTVAGHSLYIRPTIIGTRDCTHTPTRLSVPFPQTHLTSLDSPRRGGVRPCNVVHHSLPNRPILPHRRAPDLAPCGQRARPLVARWYWRVQARAQLRADVPPATAGRETRLRPVPLAHRRPHHRGWRHELLRGRPPRRRW